MVRLLSSSLVVGASFHASQISTSTAFAPSSTRNVASQYTENLSTTPSSSTKLSSTIESSRISLSSDCDNSNTPPSLRTILDSIVSLKSGSDIRGTFTDHKRLGTILNASLVMKNKTAAGGGALTPLSAYCYGHAFARRVVQSKPEIDTSTLGIFESADSNIVASAAIFDLFSGEGEAETGVEEVETTICVGRDPRIHGARLADALCRGIESVKGVKAVYTGLASTPSMFEFCRAGKCDGAVMVTASHLPEDRNGFKFCTKAGSLNGNDIDMLAETAAVSAREWYDIGILPPTSGADAVYCSSAVDFMPHYASTLRSAIIKEVSDGDSSSSATSQPLAGLRIVLNAGNGSGYFFNEILKDLGADVSASMNLTPDGTFPKDSGVPNPEYQAMIDTTTRVCEKTNADIGIMLDTDGDRCGFVIPRNNDDASSPATYEALNRNRLIALLSVIFQTTSPGCSVVTDSVTSEGLAKFLEEDLGLSHVRYLKGYANVIEKAKEITDSGKATVEMAIETSGHCAMRENDYLDDGTYTSVKVIGLLARVAKAQGENRQGHLGLLDLISNLDEMEEVDELRLSVLDGTLSTTDDMFDSIAKDIEKAIFTQKGWELDQENLEGIRVRNGSDGSFFMLRKSLHDPVISLQVEGSSADDVRQTVISPLLEIIESKGDQYASSINSSALSAY